MQHLSRMGSISRFKLLIQPLTEGGKFLIAGQAARQGFALVADMVGLLRRTETQRPGRYRLVE